MKALSILGSTGSIGRNTLKIAARFPDRFQVRALAAKSSVELLAEQIQTHRPAAAAVYDREAAGRLREMLPAGCTVEILSGPEGYRAVAAAEGVDMVVGAMVGAAGLEPTLSAISAGKDIALANKETLVMAGALVTRAAASAGVRLLPIDSEHSAVFQCLQGHRREDLDKVILTASGGPFRCKPAEEFACIRPADALKHPNWQMGAKITIDSATLMNKGLEVIEACWLFGLTTDRIEVLVHPQSIIHSMVAYRDGSLIAQLGIPDMQGAIAYALSFPDRLPLQQPLPNLVHLGALTFEEPDMKRFRCLALALAACRAGGSLPAVMNAANEVAVQAFLENRIAFTDIPEIIDATLQAHDPIGDPGLEEILHADRWARQTAAKRSAECDQPAGAGFRGQ